MKYGKYTFTLLFVFLIVFVISMGNEKKIIENTTHTIKIVDNITNEFLVGVKVGDKYSDLDGNITINSNELLTLELISYENLHIVVKNDDSVVRMNSIK